MQTFLLKVINIQHLQHIGQDLKYTFLRCSIVQGREKRIECERYLCSDYREQDRNQYKNSQQLSAQRFCNCPHLHLF